MAAPLIKVERLRLPFPAYDITIIGDIGVMVKGVVIWSIIYLIPFVPLS